eukprot:m.165124 g.165124  ORF g.165124 m.165124 type:complete len:95 (+) comp14419_c0_seq4:28-312(+)
MAQSMTFLTVFPTYLVLRFSPLIGCVYVEEVVALALVMVPYTRGVEILFTALHLFKSSRACTPQLAERLIKMQQLLADVHGGTVPPPKRSKFTT